MEILHDLWYHMISLSHNGLMVSFVICDHGGLIQYKRCWISSMGIPIIKIKWSHNRYGMLSPFSVQRLSFPVKRNPIIKIRWSWDCLTISTKIPILMRWHLILKWPPGPHVVCYMIFRPHFQTTEYNYWLVLIEISDPVNFSSVMNCGKCYHRTSVNYTYSH